MADFDRIQDSYFAAKLAGMAANKKGVAEEACPYEPFSVSYDGWKAGWRAAQTDTATRRGAPLR